MNDDYVPDRSLQDVIDAMRFPDWSDSGSGQFSYFKESHGSSGGYVIYMLDELTTYTPEVIKETVTKYLGIVRWFGDGRNVGGGKKEPFETHKTLRIFENEQYRFICLEDIEVAPFTGGTEDAGDVELYLNPKRIERECPMCGQTFVAQRNTKEVCSDRCRQRKKRAGAKTKEKVE